MIFVTVGTHDQGFERLVKAADELATLVEEKVLIQKGCTKYQPIFADHFCYANSQEINDFIQQASVVVSQASAGTIINVLSLKKPLVVIPRLKKFKENWTDHQVELARALAAQKIAFAILSEELSGAILRDALARVHQFLPPFDSSAQLIRALREQLKILEQQMG
ncbi:MAG: glycosyltransferase [Anaerolineales bacterium]